MPAKSTTFANSVLALFFNGTAIPDLAQDDGSSPATTLTVALHTASPGVGGTQSTNEISYTGYARIAVARTSGGWTVSAGSVVPVANIDFGVMTAGTGGTVTHWSVGSGVSNYLMYFGTVTPNIVVANGVTPRLTTGSTGTES